MAPLSHTFSLFFSSQHDDAAVKELGVRQATNIIRRLCDETDIRGFHICTLNLEKSVRGLLESLGWVSPKTAVQKGPGGLLPDQQPWDEFPNGRYGDSRSPAYGELDGYGVSLKVAPQEALRLWGFPLAEADVSTIFCDYLCGRRTSIPWCDCPIMDETASIRSELLSLNSAQRTWWTVGSQPAVDGVDSSDPTYGFGPKAGHVFQKAFVEFFATEQHLAALQQRIAASAGREEGWITFLAGNRRGDFVTNMREGDVNAVTWAVFPGQEIVQSTIIEEESFKAWRVRLFFPSQAGDSSLIYVLPILSTGRGLCHLGRVGAPLCQGLAHARAPPAHRRRAVARHRRTPRLQTRKGPLDLS